MDGAVSRTSSAPVLEKPNTISVSAAAERLVTRPLTLNGNPEMIDEVALALRDIDCTVSASPA